MTKRQLVEFLLSKIPLNDSLTEDQLANIVATELSKLAKAA